MRCKRSGFLIILVITLSLIAGCNEVKKTGGERERGKKLTVYTSFYTMYDFTRKIGGDRIELVNLVPPGTEPHDWEPAPRDIAGLEKADLLIYNGAGMEGWLDKTLASVNNPRLVAVVASKGVGASAGRANGELRRDPHVWLNPLLAKKQLEIIKDALVSADPADREYFEKNYATNARKLDELDREYRAAVAGFKRKEIFVAHQAFGYLADAFGFTQVPIEGLNADAEPTPDRMAEIARLARKKGARYIFFEELISPKVAEAIAREVGAETEALDPFEGPKDDSGQGKEYFAVMRKNLETLKKALK